VGKGRHAVFQTRRCRRTALLWGQSRAPGTPGIRQLHRLETINKPNIQMRARLGNSGSERWRGTRARVSSPHRALVAADPQMIGDWTCDGNLSICCGPPDPAASLASSQANPEVGKATPVSFALVHVAHPAAPSIAARARRRQRPWSHPPLGQGTNSLPTESVQISDEVSVLPLPKRSRLDLRVMSNLVSNTSNARQASPRSRIPSALHPDQSQGN
jgi:hypothetical protein